MKVDLDAARRFGSSRATFGRAAATIMSGHEVSDIHEGAKVVRRHGLVSPGKRNSVNSIRELAQLTRRTAAQVRLADVADVRIVPTPNIIQREGLSRRIDVAANVRGRDLGSVSADVAERLKTVKFPLGYDSQTLGRIRREAGARNRSAAVVGSSRVGIFLLLQICFNSWIAGGTRFGPAGSAGEGFCRLRG